MNRLALGLCLAATVASVVITSLVWNAMGTSGIEDCPTEKPAPAPGIPEAFNEEELQILRDKITSQADRIVTLQKQLANQTNAMARVVETSSDLPRNSYLDQLLEEDPERHQRILAKLQETNEQTAQALADSAEFLFNLDMSLMTEEQLASHQDLLGLIEASWAQLDRMAENPQGSEAEAARTKLHQNVMAMHNAFQTERQTALEQYLQWQGFSPEDALAMRTEIEDLYSKTEPANILPGTQFVGENMMIGMERTDEGDGSQSISFSIGGLLESE